jgi:hypothetical protein
MLNVVTRPHGRIDIHMASRRRASALPMCGFPAFRRQLQHPSFAADPSSIIFEMMVPLPEQDNTQGIHGLKISGGSGGNSSRYCTYVTFERPPYLGFSMFTDHAARTTGSSISPLPYQAWHGYTPTIGRWRCVPTGMEAHPPPKPPPRAGTGALLFGSFAVSTTGHKY